MPPFVKSNTLWGRGWEWERGRGWVLKGFIRYMISVTGGNLTQKIDNQKELFDENVSGVEGD